jgi:phosphoglycolate phosphatase-like HAD superfamily hydrolase
VTAVAIDLDGVLGDTRPLWNAWLDDVGRRARVELELPEDRVAAAAELDRRIGNWRALLERFAEEHAAVYLRPDAQVAAALRHLQTEGVRIGVFTDAPEPLARVALGYLGAARRVEAVEIGEQAIERLRERLGPRAVVVRTRGALETWNT